MSVVRDAIADVLLSWGYDDGGIYDHVDRLIMSLDSAGFVIEQKLLPGMPGLFVLDREVDETGVSGTGIVAEGIEFSDDVVALRWRGEWPTSVVFHDRGIESVLHVHGHGGKTKVRWLR